MGCQPLQPRSVSDSVKDLEGCHTVKESEVSRGPKQLRFTVIDLITLASCLNPLGEGAFLALQLNTSISHST